MCDPLTLTPPGLPQELEVGLDFHKVLDAMLVPKIEVPTRQCIDALISLERFGARITIISFTGHEGYLPPCCLPNAAFPRLRSRSGAPYGRRDFFN